MKPVITFLDRATIAPHICLRKPRFSHTWQEYPTSTSAQLPQRLHKTTIAITNKVPLLADTLSVLPNLKMIAVAATGTDIIDLDYCKAHNIVVSNVRRYTLHSVAEHTFALILALRRQLFAYRQTLLNGDWQSAKIFCLFTHRILDLHESRLGIIGGGALGQAVADLGRAFGMEVVFAERKYSDPSSRPAYLGFDEIVQSSDIISLHCPLNPDTQHMIAMPEFKKMKRTALLINTARGNLIQEKDLATALKQGLIAGAALDVVSHEPIDAHNPLLGLLDTPNFILTPHTAWTSDQAMQALSEQLISNIENFAKGKPVNIVQKHER